MPGKKLLPFLFFIFLYSCTKTKNEQSTGSIEGEYVEVSYAKGFSILKTQNGATVSFFSAFRDSEDTLVYQFTRTDDVNLARGARVIKYPINSLALMASTYAAFLEELDKISIVKAVSNRSYFFNRSVQKGIDENRIIEVGYGQNIDFEKVIVLNPQLVLISGMSSSEFDHYSKLVATGIEILPFSEWREDHPLGRAEWIKVFGAITGKLEEAIKIFEEVEKRYHNSKKSVEQVTEKPKVIVNAPYKDIWWLPGGKSYMSILIQDAKADYPWKEDENMGGIQSDLEAVFYQAGNSDFWINPSGFTSLEDLATLDPRFKEFNAFKVGQVFNNTLRVGPEGGNDYFESGIVRPDLVLEDLIEIFHPEINSERNFYFYEKLK